MGIVKQEIGPRNVKQQIAFAINDQVISSHEPTFMGRALIIILLDDTRPLDRPHFLISNLEL